VLVGIRVIPMSDASAVRRSTARTFSSPLYHKIVKKTSKNPAKMVKEKVKLLENLLGANRK
jgi:hypothetical protein